MFFLHPATKHSSPGGIVAQNKRTVLDNSNGILEPDDEEISRVYCRACDKRFTTRDTYSISRHNELPIHKGTLAEYTKMVAENETTNYRFPYDAARCRYQNRSLFECFSNNDVQHITIAVEECTIGNKTVYECRCFCSFCQKNVPANVRSVAGHNERLDHKIDSKGFSGEIFNEDLCKLFLKRKYVD